MKFRKSTFEIDICGSERPKKHLALQSELWTFQKIKNYWNPSTELGERFSQTLSLSVEGGGPYRSQVFPIGNPPQTSDGNSRVPDLIALT